MTPEPSYAPENSLSSSSKSINPLYLVGGLAVIGVLGGMYFLRPASSGSSMTASPSPTPLVVVASPAANTMLADDSVQVINLEAGSFYYKPAEIRVKKGQKVKIVMNSVDMMHDFNIDELKVKLPITKSGETNTVEFTPDTVGTFEYYCSVGQHRQNGQVGTLIVEES